MAILQPKTTHQIFEATVSLELDYFITLLEEDITISDLGKRVSIKDTGNNGYAIYFDNRCIFTITSPDPEKSEHFIPAVERFYLDPAQNSTIQQTQ